MKRDKYQKKGDSLIILRGLMHKHTQNKIELSEDKNHRCIHLMYRWSVCRTHSQSNVLGWSKEHYRSELEVTQKREWTQN